jgi:hypothetical protein
MLPVALDCPLFIAPSVFSNVYLMQGSTLLFKMVILLEKQEHANGRKHANYSRTIAHAI